MNFFGKTPFLHSWIRILIWNPDPATPWIRIQCGSGSETPLDTNSPPQMYAKPQTFHPCTLWPYHRYSMNLMLYFQAKIIWSDVTTKSVTWSQATLRPTLKITKTWAAPTWAAPTWPAPTGAAPAWAHPPTWAPPPTWAAWGAPIWTAPTGAAPTSTTRSAPGPRDRPTPAAGRICRRIWPSSYISKNSDRYSQSWPEKYFVPNEREENCVCQWEVREFCQPMRSRAVVSANERLENCVGYWEIRDFNQQIGKLREGC